ncbi:hypothetical protein JX265_005750 [Neoarthrinium moseri]|uniref:Zn(2)-C6 fungal-type domain-containing protein n=1 Tax=Neoarthrinium moseri TaxID=1658444 RepID=A0A9P9WN74_9PEZI|nr:uncharacterized protein JN550_012279 [Neoarthrinium moseri]KAI1839904.1 hypothetical protein JX266_013885 [Neoarthrinium moseri]KAI1858921.1 hypothetical protein JN550_012279 [Neoarthrinium moseri]KAI1871764.1 hypothetical protein JX265_005750 [Neoarthrinium moseri]
MATPASQSDQTRDLSGAVGPGAGRPSPDGPELSNDSPEGRRTSKRRRIAIACSACRSKKSRCDGQRPKCSSCQSQNIDCAYAQTPLPGTIPMPKIFLQLMETRVASLENDVQQLKQQQSGSFSSQVSQADAASGRRMSDPRPDDEMFESSVSPDGTDGVGSIEFTDEMDSGYFGPSSNIAFTRNIKEALGFLLGSRQDIRNQSAGVAKARQTMLHVSRPPSPSPRSSEAWINDKGGQDCLRMPPSYQMEALMDQFFADPGALFPYVHQETFMGTYWEVKRSGFKRFRRSWLGLLNAILAVATAASTSVTLTSMNRAARAEVFFARAHSLCMNQMIGGANVETVQVMLLMSQYLQGTHRSMKTWNIHGLAIKACFQLGLHSENALKSRTPLEREIRARTWFGCVLLDRTLSMTFGRPPSIPETYVRVSLPQLYEQHMSPETSDRMAEAQSTQFFVSAISNLGTSSNNSITTLASSVLQIEHQFLEWQSNLPPFQGLITPEDLPSSDEYSLARRLRVVLTLRYHNLRILAHRPILDKCLEAAIGGEANAAEISMLNKVGWRSKSICVQSSSALISIIHDITMAPEPKWRLLGAWWFSLYYAFNAALTIIAVLLTEESVTSTSTFDAMGISEGLLHATLDQAISSLPLIDVGNKMVEKCAKFVTTLRYYLNMLKSSDSASNTTTESPVNHVANASNGSGVESFNILADMSHVEAGFESDFFSTLNPDFTTMLYNADVFF